MGMLVGTFQMANDVTVPLLSLWCLMMTHLLLVGTSEFFLLTLLW